MGQEEIEKKEKLRERGEYGGWNGRLSAHQSLVWLLQLAGLGQREAGEDAGRMEDIISEDAIRGIFGLLKRSGQCVPGGRAMSLNLGTWYDEGVYEFCMGIYDAERRYPRVLAKEFMFFGDMARVEVKKESSEIFLRECGEAMPGYLWYLSKEGWEIAERTEIGFGIPANAFSFTMEEDSLFLEGDAVIAFTGRKRQPAARNCRELNIHLW